MPDYTPLNHKLENAFVTYITSILDDMALDTLQVIANHQSVEALETPRLVCECVSMSPRSISIPGWMDCEVSIQYISQDGDLTAEQHKANVATIISWLHDIATVKAALDATEDLSTLLYQFTGVNLETNAEEGTRMSSMMFNVIAAGA